MAAKRPSIFVLQMVSGSLVIAGQAYSMKVRVAAVPADPAAAVAVVERQVQTREIGHDHLVSFRLEIQRSQRLGS